MPGTASRDIRGAGQPRGSRTITTSDNSQPNLRPFKGQPVSQEKSASLGRGPLLAIGGAEDKKRDRIILRRFVELSGGSDARIVIIPTASGIPYAGDRYRTIFQHLGVGQSDTLTINDRSDANNPQLAQLLTNATGVFMTGGNQIKVAAMLGGSVLAEALREINTRGTPIAGTSAGASVMSKIMVAGGQPGRIPKSNMGQMSAGLGLIENVIIDQHFRERDRVARLLTMVSYNPGLIGVGVDEDTAALFWPDNRLEVLGRRAVMIIDGSEMDSDVYAHRSSRPLTISNAIIHFIASGGHFDLNMRRTITDYPTEEQVADG